MKRGLLAFAIGVFFVLSMASSGISSEWALKLGTDEAQVDFSLSQLKDLPASEAQRHGFTYKGVLLRDFLTHAGIDIGKIEYVEIVASDGYKVKYDRKLARSFKVILAYEKGGLSLPEKEGKIRAIVPGGRSATQVKSVEKIFVKTGKWRLTFISNKQEKEYTLSELQKIPSEELSFSSKTYRGVSLITFLEKAGINIEKVKTVEVISADNYRINYEQTAILNDRVILAYEMDGMPLPEKMGTVRCVFSGEDKKMQVKMVERIIVE